MRKYSNINQRATYKGSAYVCIRANVCMLLSIQVDFNVLIELNGLPQYWYASATT